MKTKLLATTAIIASTAAVIGLSGAQEAEAAKGKERCYGVAKAGKNDCGSKDGAHSCAGLAKKDSDTNEWVYLPEGVCDKLTGGIKG